MQAGCIDEYDLPVLAGRDAEQLIARGLRMIGYDRDLFADESIHQAGFSDIRATHNRNEAGTEFLIHT